MTWHYRVSDDDSTLEVWDHTQDPALDAPIATKNNNGSGFELPTDVLAVMDAEVTGELPEQADAGNAGNSQGLSQRGGFILRDMSMRNIEEYTG